MLLLSSADIFKIIDFLYHFFPKKFFQWQMVWIQIRTAINKGPHCFQRISADEKLPLAKKKIYIYIHLYTFSESKAPDELL